MIPKNLQNLLEMLKADDYCTASQMADVLKVSEKTARLRVKELDSELKAYGAKVTSKSRYGYSLVIEDKAKFEKLTEKKSSEHLPTTEQERNEFLLSYLIWHKEYIKSDELCDFLFVSKTTLTRSIKNIEMILKRYNIFMERRPNYGIRLEGKESDIRKLIIDYFVKGNSLKEIVFERKETELVMLASCVWKLTEKYDIHLSETSFESFLNYIYVAWKRMKHGFYLESGIEKLPEMSENELGFVKEVLLFLKEDGQMSYVKEEEDYLLLYLAGKRMIGSAIENETNFVIREQTDTLALTMLNVVNQSYHMNFHNNFDVRMTLNQHLVPFDIRMRFDIPLENPYLDEIKKKYSLAYQISCEAVQVLRDYYKKDIPEEEIGYFALIFELAMSREQREERSDILVVCSTGKGSSRLLKYKYEQEFSDYLNHIYVCDLQELNNFDFSKVQYIFTTVPITRKVPIPIVEVGAFLGTEDIQRVTDVLRKGTGEYLKKYYRPERFFTNVKVESKEAALEYICNIICRQEKVDDNFYELVLERESYIQMDYGFNIAIPHPNGIASEETFAYVAILEKPIIWNQNSVQVILLTSVGRDEDKYRQKFYEATARFALSAASIEKLIKEPTYKVLMELLIE